MSILQSINELRHHSVGHRDLRPSNTIFPFALSPPSLSTVSSSSSSEPEPLQAVLIDFGQALTLDITWSSLYNGLHVANCLLATWKIKLMSKSELAMNLNRRKPRSIHNTCHRNTVLQNPVNQPCAGTHRPQGQRSCWVERICHPVCSEIPAEGKATPGAT